MFLGIIIAIQLRCPYIVLWLSYNKTDSPLLIIIDLSKPDRLRKFLTCKCSIFINKLYHHLPKHIEF